MKSLLARIENRKAVVGIVGMGYVGLPLAQAFAGAGFRVVGFDIDREKIKALMAGRSYIKHIPAQDAVIVSTNHACYDYPFIVKHSRLVVDTRNACAEVAGGRQKIVKA